MTLMKYSYKKCLFERVNTKPSLGNSQSIFFSINVLKRSKMINSKYRSIVDIYHALTSLIVFTKIMIGLNCSDYILIKHHFFFCSKIVFSRFQLSTINVNKVVRIMLRIHFQMIKIIHAIHFRGEEDLYFTSYIRIKLFSGI